MGPLNSTFMITHVPSCERNKGVCRLGIPGPRLAQPARKAKVWLPCSLPILTHVPRSDVTAILAFDLRNPVKLVSYRKYHLQCLFWNRQHQPLTPQTALAAFGRQRSQEADQVGRGKPGRLQGGGGGFFGPSPSKGLHSRLTRTHRTKARPSAASNAASNRDTSGHTPNYLAWLPVLRAKQRDTGSRQTTSRKHRERTEYAPGDPRWGRQGGGGGTSWRNPAPFLVADWWRR